ncbi:apolipoprotein L3-like [Micropterus salmoides]|uniref:apolipoprotein L3-like n=1 Tax=Micropterus salmoides TaxID=27706 RepID=UPI0018ECFA69|nr:apolipoprotein L3-like [Micropterus salmoides]
MDYCHGGSLAAKIKEMSEPPQECKFSAETPIQLIPKILGGSCPPLPETFSPDLCQLLNDILKRDPRSRPTASEILGRPFIISCLLEKNTKTVKDLQTRLDRLKAVADGLEHVHHGTTTGSLTGGVIGAVGGITSIVGLILAPFTLGASLIVTGVEIGVGALGGVTAGASNITNMVNQSSDRKAVRYIIKKIEQKMNAVVTWLQEISNSLQTIGNLCQKLEDSSEDNLLKLGCRAGKGLAGIAELVRLVQVMNVGKIVAQASRVVRVAEAATGVLAGLFVAVDVFFIAMDAKEIHYIKQAKEAEKGGKTGSKSVSQTSNAQDQSSQNTAPIRSEIMKFVRSIRQAADNLQEVLDELKSCIKSIPTLRDDNELEWKDMELM